MDQQTAKIFDSAAWVHLSYEFCNRAGISPNALAYNESSGTLCVIVKRSRRGDDYALSQSALNYLLEKLKAGALKDGSLVRSAIVVLGDLDKPGKQFTAEELRDRFSGVEPWPGKLGPYWWITISDCDEDRFE